MIINITCALEDEESEGHDRLLPYLAKCDFRGVEARDITAGQAIANVQGICLCTLGQFQTPPTLIRFTVTFVPSEAEPEGALLS